jgi:hypothetical protein
MRRRSVPLAVIAILASLAFALPAQAAPQVREKYSGTDSFDFDDCGFWIHDEVSFQGVFMLKRPRAADGPPYWFDNYDNLEVLSANGRTAYLSHQGLYKDLRITRVSGTVWQFVTMEAGQPWVLRDADGNVLIRDRGRLSATFQVDTLGDNDPDNDIFIEDSWSLLQDAGRHDAFYLDFCEVMDAYFNG